MLLVENADAVRPCQSPHASPVDVLAQQDRVWQTPVTPGCNVYRSGGT
jgi:hypothetical protein